jgi:acetyl esterase/lipase
MMLTSLLLLLVGATAFLPPQVAAERDVEYVAGGSTDQTLDLYVPAVRGFPVVIFIHGGSLQAAGERRSSPAYQGVCAPLVAAGIGCATIDYRLAPASRWPAMPDDVAAAVKWVKTNIASRGGDPGRVFLFGHSSGCELAAVVGANDKYLARVGLHTTDIAGVVAMGCVLAPLEETLLHHSMDDLRARWPKSDDARTYASLEDWLDSDPSRFLGPHVPPVLVVCSEAERFFPAILEQGAKFVRRLLEIQRPANLAVVPGRHMTSIASFGTQGDATFAAVKAFVANPGGVAPKEAAARRPL